jgi:hypothetical protein
MMDGDAAVSCRVTAFFLLGRAAQDEVRTPSAVDLFRLYRTEIEAIASAQFDSGRDTPWVSAADLGRS